jgi:CRISPR/Cas system endoribonuclease Cas6 (RAMP superfamily)
MQINVIYDQSAGNLPSGFVAAVNYVVNYYDTSFTNAVTVNIDLGYGEIGGQSLGSGALGESETYFDSVAYSTAVNALKANQPSVTQQTAYSTLPGSSPVGGGTLWMSTAEERSLGLLAGNNSAIDGYVGLSSVYPFSYAAGVTPAAGQYYFEGVLAHEFSEVMGRDSLLGDGLGGTNSYTPMDLFRYSGPGARQLGTGGPAYFSINGGTTNLDSWNTNPGGDLGDWAASAGADSYLAFSPSGQLDWISQADLSLMNVLGWDTTPPPAPPVVMVPNPTVQASSTAPITMSTLVSATNATNEPMAYILYENPSDGGHFVLNGTTTEPIGQIFGVSRLSQLTYVPVAGHSDSLLVGASDADGFSGWSNLQINGPVLTPVVTIPNPTVQASSTQPITMSTLVSATNATNEPMAYILYENPSDGGHFVLNGTTTEPVGQIFGVSQLSQLTYVPVAGHSDSLLVGASDADGFSGWSNLQINGPVPTPPVVTVPNPTVNAGSTQPIAMSTLVSETDANNEPTAYILYENPSDGGHFVLNGTTTEPIGQIFGLAASQLSQLTYVPVAGHSDSLLVGASDTDGFSGWSNLQINGPVLTPVVTIPNPTVHASSTQPIAVSTLVSAMNATNDPMAYILYENPSDGGHFVLNGTTTEPVGEIFGVAATQLSQLTYVPVAGHSDSLLVGASDADGFSGWSNLLINGPAAMAIAISTFGPDTGAGASGWQPTLALGQSGSSDPLPGATNGLEFGGGGGPKPPAGRFG